MKLHHIIMQSMKICNNLSLKNNRFYYLLMYRRLRYIIINILFSKWIIVLIVDLNINYKKLSFRYFIIYVYSNN